MTRLEVLFEQQGLPTYDLPDHLSKLYGGTLGFPAECVYANFVA